MADLLHAARRPRMTAHWFAIALSLIVASVLGCRGQGPVATAPPPPDVSVAHPVLKDVVEWDTYTGYLQAPEVANVMARVSGLVVDMPFEEGSIVKRGDLLAMIDDRSFKADMNSKQADLQKAEAALSISNVTCRRLMSLRSENAGAVSMQDIDNAQAGVEQAEAVLAGAKAALETSRLNLEWCRVESPIDGRVSNKIVTVGNLVNGGAGQATLLTTVQSVSPIYCYIDIDERSILKYDRLAKQNSLLSARNGQIPCFVQLGNEKGFPHKGVIDFVDNHLDTTTGTMRVRGILDNESGTLIPGFFARLCVPGSGRYQAVLVPDTAIGNDQSQRNVLVVDKDDKVAVRPVKLGALFGGLRSIVDGVSPDDRVVINGQMHARPGSLVAPIEVQIHVNEADFADPGQEVARTTPAPDANGSASTSETSAPPMQSARSAGSARQ